MFTPRVSSILLSLFVLVAIVTQVRANANAACIANCEKNTGIQKCFSGFQSNMFDRDDMTCLCSNPDFFSGVTSCFNTSHCMSVDVSDFWNMRNSRCGYTKENPAVVNSVNSVNTDANTVWYTHLTVRNIIFLACAAIILLLVLICCIRGCCCSGRGKAIYVPQARYYQPSAYPVGSQLPGQYYVSAAPPPPPYAATSNVVNTPYGDGKLV